jgi:hypothetical protein
MQRLVFLMPGDVVHSTYVPKTSNSHALQKTIGRTMGSLMSSVVPSIGMTRMQLYSDTSDDSPITMSEAPSADRLFIRTGVRGLPQTREEIVFIPHLVFDADGIRSQPHENCCVRMDGDAVTSMGFVDALLQMLCPMSGICSDRVQTVLHPSIAAKMQEPSHELFDPDRLVGAANTTGALHVVSNDMTRSRRSTISRRRVGLSYSMMKESPAESKPPLTEKASRRKSRDFYTSFVASSPKAVVMEVSKDTTDVPSAKLALQIALSESGVDTSVLKDAVVYVGKTPVSVFSGSEIFENSRGVDHRKIISAAQRGGVRLII